jgi:predicted glutamine amidotransferase
VFHSIEPAWNDQNLRELAGHITSATSSRWLFMHNGYVAESATVRRDLVLAVDESLYPEIKGQAVTV